MSKRERFTQEPPSEDYHRVMLDAERARSTALMYEHRREAEVWEQSAMDLLRSVQEAIGVNGVGSAPFNEEAKLTVAALVKKLSGGSST